MKVYPQGNFDLYVHDIRNRTKSEGFVLSGKTEKQKRLFWDQSFSTYSKFSEKLTFFNPLIRTQTCAYQEGGKKC